jgi:Rieske Fe-S protein
VNGETGAPGAPEAVSTAPDGRPPEAQPRWRRDFPIDWPEDELVARRDFTKFLVLTSFAFVVGQAWIVFENLVRKGRGKPPVVRIASLDAIPEGGAVVFDYPGPHDARILVRTGPKSFVAYGQKCTHLSCAVVPEPDEGRLHCPCHNGSFDLATGAPLAGPPRRPLERVLLELRGNDLYATGVEVRG